VSETSNLKLKLTDRMLKGTCGPLQDEEDLYSPSSIVRVIKSRGMDGKEIHTKFWLENCIERDHLLNLSINWRIYRNRV
jgi:hypothetical protein